MNYYQDSSFDYYMNNRNQDYDNDFDNSKEYNSHCFDNKGCHNHNNNHSCCIKKIEETYLCFPSYYNEEKKEEKKECRNCWEGTFKICPKHDCYEDKMRFDDKDEHKCNYRSHKRCCGFCGLFGRW